MGRVEGKVAVVTGAARNVGLATARRLTEEGAIVIMADINEADGVKNAAELGCEFYHLDVSSESDWVALIDHIRERYGKLNLLVNNAAICITADVVDDTLENWRKTHAVNTESVFLSMKYGLPLMEAGGGGSIVSVSSSAALNGNFLTPAYAASKAGVRALTQSVAIRCRRQGNGIRCNTVHPDAIDPTMLPAEITGADREALEEHSRQMIGSFMCQPEDVANTILFLCSDESRHINGAAIVVDNTATISHPYP